MGEELERNREEEREGNHNQATLYEKKSVLNEIEI